jgi:CheY-like chemotaxis protein
MKTLTEISEPASHQSLFSGQAISQSPNGGKNPLASFRVLVMDDNEIYLEQLRQMLSPEVLGVDHIELVTSHNPVTFIGLIEEQRFDMLLMNFHLPRLDGLKFLEWLTTSEHPNPGVPKVVLIDDPETPDGVRASIAKHGATILSKHASLSNVKALVWDELRSKGHSMRLSQ